MNKRSHPHALPVRRAVLLLGELAAFCAMLAYFSGRTGTVSLSAGETVTRNITAPFTGTDEYLSDKARQKARDNAGTVFVTDSALVKTQKTAIENWFASCDGFLGDMLTVWESYARKIEGNYLYQDTPWLTMVPESRMAEALSRRGIGKELSVEAAYLVLNEYLPAGKVHAAGELPDISDFKTAFTGTVYPLLESGVRTEELSSVREKAKSTMKKTSVPSAMKTELAGKLIDTYLKATVRADAAATEENRRAAADRAGSVLVYRGQVILKKGTVADEEDIAHLEALGLLAGQTENGRDFGALLLYHALVSLAVFFRLVLFDKRTLLDKCSILRFTCIVALGELLSFLFAFAEPGAAPLLLPVLLCLATEGRREQAASALLFTTLTAPLLIGTEGVFSAETFELAASAAVGGFTSLLLYSLTGGTRRTSLPAGLLGGVAAGLTDLGILLYAGTAGAALVTGPGFLFIGGLLASLLAGLFRPLIDRLFAKRKNGETI